MAKTTMAAPVNRLVEAMPKPLQQVYKTISSLIAKDAQAGIMSCYTIGLEIAKVQKGPRQFGEAAVGQLAEALDLAPGKLWDCCRLTEVWSAAQLKKLLATKNARGLSLSLTHLRDLASIEDDAMRQKLQTACLAEGWSTKELINQIQAEQGARLSTGGRKPTAPNTPVSGLQQLGKLAVHLTNREEIYDTSIFTRIDEMTDAQINERLLTELEETRKHCEELMTFAKTTIRKVDVARDRVRKLVEAKGGVTAPAQPRKQSVAGQKVAARAAKAKPAAKAVAKPAAKVAKNGRPTTDYDDRLGEGEVMPARPARRPVKGGKPDAKAVPGRKQVKTTA